MKFPPPPPPPPPLLLTSTPFLHKNSVLAVSKVINSLQTASLANWAIFAFALSFAYILYGIQKYMFSNALYFVCFIIFKKFWGQEVTLPKYIKAQPLRLSNKKLINRVSSTYRLCLEVEIPAISFQQAPWGPSWLRSCFAAWRGGGGRRWAVWTSWRGRTCATTGPCRASSPRTTCSGLH